MDDYSIYDRYLIITTLLKTFIMRNLIKSVFVIACICISFLAHSQQTEVNVGIGLVPTIISGAGGLPISVSVDKPLASVKNATIGGYLGYYGSSVDLGAGFSDEYKLKYSVFIFGARGTYHFDFIDNDKLDPYAGLMLGYNIVTSRYDGPGSEFFDGAASSGFGYAGLIGMKYQATDSIKVFGELGYGISVLTFGATFSL